MKNLIGKKIGMTRVFNDEGTSIPVTIIEITNNRITQVKSIPDSNYNKIQITTGIKKNSHLKRPEIGHLKKSKVSAGIGFWEFYTKNKNLNIGEKLEINLLEKFSKVDVTGITKGKGFSGTVKRWGFSMQDASHGNSLSHRAPGSIGQNQTPGRVVKGKKMAGHLGCNRKTVKNLSIVSVDIKNNILLIKGSIPGFMGSYISIKIVK